MVVMLVMIPISARADSFIINMAPGWDRELTAMTDYVVRGISQTNGRPSVGATSVYTFANGWYGGLTAEHSELGEQGVEADFVGGYKTALTSALNYNLGVVYQSYPGSRYHSLNNVEFQNILNYVQPWGTVVAAFALQPQAALHSGVQTYTSAGVDFNLPASFTLGGRVGYLTASNHAVQINYVDWTATLARDMGHGISLAVQYTGVTMHCSTCGNRFVVSINFVF